MPNILDVLDEYVSVFPDERDRLRQFSDLVHNCDSPQSIRSRKNFVGHITASGFILSPCKTKVLLVYHKQLRKHLQPGGHFDHDDETPLEVALREIKEETGITSLTHLPFHFNSEVPIDIDTHQIPECKSKNEHSHWHHDFRYLFLCGDDTAVTLDENESTGYQWVEIRELLRMNTFAALTQKIQRVLSREFRPQKFYNSLIKMLGLEQHVSSVVVAHAIPDAVDYLNAVAQVSQIRALLPKPRSIVPSVLRSLEKRFNVVQLTREQIAGGGAVSDILVSANGGAVLFDIGGYFAPVLDGLAERLGERLLGVIEDTENGYQKYASMPTLPVPVYSVARSPLKASEDFLVGQSVVFSADAILRECGKLIQYLNCSVFGFGKIGASIAHHLLLRGAKPNVFDTNPIRRLDAQNRLCRTPERTYILRHSDVLFCATGSHVLDIIALRELKPGCFVFSVTSSDDEMDLRFLESEYSSEDVAQYVTKYSSFNNHFYLVNRGNAVNFIHQAVLGDFIHLVRGEMICALKCLLSSTPRPGMHELPEETRKQVADIWLSTFVDEQGGL